MTAWPDAELGTSGTFADYYEHLYRRDIHDGLELATETGTYRAIYNQIRPHGVIDMARSPRPLPTNPPHQAKRRKNRLKSLARDNSGQHRLPISDLLIAAVAEVNSLTILHYDKDFDTISQATGQPAQWIAPRGSV